MRWCIVEELYIAILEITEGNIRHTSERLDLKKDIHKYEGVEFQILSIHGDFIQILLHAYNPYITILLDACGVRTGIKFDEPALFEMDGGFAGVFCSYILQISRHPIEIEYLYTKLGLTSMQGRVPGFYQITPDFYQKLSKTLEHTGKITDFLEMMHYVDTNQKLFELTKKMIQDTVVYGDHFFSEKNTERKGQVSFQENMTLLAAKPYTLEGKRTAILNFANPIEPGGGVLRGADAQEEYLCRSSNLYKSLTAKSAVQYYFTNKEIMSQNQFNSMFLGTDMVIYSPNVVVLKETVGYNPFFTYDGTERYQNDCYYIDVLTCAAPFFSGSGYILPNGDLEYLLKKRIRNIFEAAIENEIEVIILGAFGCGAFHNPPGVVANAFRSVLLEPRYSKAFDEVVFAVKRTQVVCPNIEAFEEKFSMFPEINNNSDEKENRLLWKWDCACGAKNMWDNVLCEKCKQSRNNAIGIYS